MANWWDDAPVIDAPQTATSGSPLDRALKSEGVTGKLADVARSIYQQESGAGRDTATSDAGATGGMQMKPDTFKRFADKGWSIENPDQNARAAVRFIKSLSDKTGGDPKLISVGYYGGEGAIPKAKAGIAVRDPRNPNAPNTLQYADQVTSRIPKTGSKTESKDEGNWWAAAPVVSADTAAPDNAQPEPTRAQQDMRGLGLGARSVAEGAASPLTFLGDTLNKGVNLGIRGVNSLAGTNIPQLGMPSQAVNNALTGIGLPQPATPTERVLSDIQSGAAGAGAGAGFTGALSGVAANPVVRNALAQLSEQPGLQMGLGAASGGSAGVAREAGLGPTGQLLASFAGGLTPLGIKTLAQSADRATRNAAKMLQTAMEHHSPEEWNQARALLSESQKQGVPLMGPEAFPGGSQVQQLGSDVAASPASGNKIREFVRPRPEQVETAGKNALARIGDNVGGQEAANQAQETADKVIRDAQKYRTEAAGPYYQGQRASDTEALDLGDQISELPSKIVALSQSRSSAVQAAGKLHAFTNEQINAANRTIRRNLGLAGDVKAGRNLDRAEEGKAGTYAAVNRGKEISAQIDASQRQLDSAADRLAEKDLPAIRSKVQSFVSNLDQQIRLAGPDEAKILKQYRDQIAPNGQPLVLPSQLESIYKANRNKINLGLNPTAEEKTAAGVLKGSVSDLDNLIKDVSPSIRNGRLIYEQLSREVVDPLLKGPIGKLAGKGADAQKEATYSRAMSEMQSDTANPKRIKTIADEFNKVDKTAFPNLTRAYLENKLNTSLKDLQGRRNPGAGANFRNALAGTPQDAANLRAMIEKSAEAQGQDPQKSYQGFRKLLDVLDATGRVPGMGSQTQSRMENAATARESLVAGALETKFSSPGGQIAKFLRNKAYGGTYKKLADVFTDPDSVRKMQELVNLKPTSLQAQRLVLSLLTSPAQRAGQDDQ
jgi:hypothetical protein